ncbi:MAG: DUF2520 domain-containing protein [Bacteroidales bacterium]|jgi:predicted short-subunit dehydrogenase-like oxidoreductase (DUF2520 family)|nr:DUF2520 domain-containing protein [Bacteroidales bacterium]
MKVVMIGAGNLAVHLSEALNEAGWDIVQVYSRSERSAKELAGRLGAEYTVALSDISQEATLYVLSVSDDAICEVLSGVSLPDRLIVHTAGSVPMEVFAGKFQNYGVLYPMQSFSKDCPVNFREIPVFLEANSPENLQTLQSLAGKISSKVYPLSSDKRIFLHLAGIFGSNFVNSLYVVAAQILHEAGLGFEVLSPLLLETARKAVASGCPGKVQTGPARRNDQQVLQRHIGLLAAYPEWQKLYVQMSDCIRKQQHG